MVWESTHKISMFYSIILHCTLYIFMIETLKKKHFFKNPPEGLNYPICAITWTVVILWSSFESPCSILSGIIRNWRSGMSPSCPHGLCGAESDGIEVSRLSSDVIYTWSAMAQVITFREGRFNPKYPESSRSGCGTELNCSTLSIIAYKGICISVTEQQCSGRNDECMSSRSGTPKMIPSIKLVFC